VVAGRIREADIAAALLGRGPALGGAAAPARGLCLRRVALGRRQRRAGERQEDEATGPNEDDE
jgi:hypothetical protein